MRLIDADEIQRQRIKDVIDAIVDSTPTVDAVEVVRCKDCKQFRKKGEGYGCCLEGYGNVDGNHYCSYGERKEE